MDGDTDWAPKFFVCSEKSHTIKWGKLLGSQMFNPGAKILNGTKDKKH